MRDARVIRDEVRKRPEEVAFLAALTGCSVLSHLVHVTVLSVTAVIGAPIGRVAGISLCPHLPVQ